MNIDWLSLTSVDRQALEQNSLATLRMLGEDFDAARLIAEDYPEILVDCRSVILDSFDNKVNTYAARSLIYHMKQASTTVTVPEELEQLIQGFAEEMYEKQANPIQSV